MTKTRLIQPLKWHGGKHYLAGRIIELMPERCKNPNAPDVADPGWLHYVEPFFGGGSVLLSMDPEGISQVVNDINNELVNFWSVLAFGNVFHQFYHSVSSTPFSEAIFEATKKAPQFHGTPEDIDRTVQRAAQFFVRNRQSRQGLGKDFATLSRNRTRRGMNEQVSSWLTAIEGLPEIHRRLQGVVILNKPALDVIQQQDGPRTLFYCDPPYLHGTRSTTSEYGEHEMTVKDHAELLNALAGIEGRFLLSGYHSELYDDFARTRYARRWRCVEIDIDNKASSKKSKDIKTECVWMNYWKD